MTDILYLSDQTLDGMGIAPAKLVSAIEDALKAKALGKLHVAPKSAILPGQGRYMMATLAIGNDGYTVVKQVSVCPDNPGRGLPAINGAIMVLDAQTGLLRALVGANWITAHRTAALSAVAAKRLADPNSTTIAFVGTGVQARSHLVAFKEMFPLTKAFAVGRSQQTLEAFCAYSDSIGVPCEIADSAEAALSVADIVVTSITLNYETAPFLDARWLRPNAFAAITDLCIPWHDESLSSFANIVIDDRQQEAESPRPMVPTDAISADLTELVTTGIERTNGPTAFAFRGIALGDYAASVLAVQIAELTGQGQRIEA